jgi:hypothetical protein
MWTPVQRNDAGVVVRLDHDHHARCLGVDGVRSAPRELGDEGAVVGLVLVDGEDRREEGVERGEDDRADQRRQDPVDLEPGQEPLDEEERRDLEDQGDDDHGEVETLMNRPITIGRIKALISAMATTARTSVPKPSI